VLEHLLSPSSSLQRLQLDHFGFRNEHLRVVTRALQTNTTLQHLQVAAGGAFSVPALQALCQVLQQRSNVTLQSCGAVIVGSPLSDGAIRLHHNTMQQQDHPSATELQWQQEHLNLWCFLNRLGQETRLVAGRTQPRAPTHREWWNMIFRVDESISSHSIDPTTTTATIVRRRRRSNKQQQELRKQSPRTAPISVLLLGLDRDDDDKLPPPPPSEEEMARNRCALGAIYVLVRSHPQHVLAAAAAALVVISSTTRSTQPEETSSATVTMTTSSSHHQSIEAESSASLNKDSRKPTNSLQENCYLSFHGRRSDVGHCVTPQSTHNHHQHDMVENNKAGPTVARSLELD
jgi:hypothetical protein